MESISATTTKEKQNGMQSIFIWISLHNCIKLSAVQSLAMDFRFFHSFAYFFVLQIFIALYGLIFYAFLCLRCLHCCNDRILHWIHFFRWHLRDAQTSFILSVSVCISLTAVCRYRKNTTLLLLRTLGTCLCKNSIFKLNFRVFTSHRSRSLILEKK